MSLRSFLRNEKSSNIYFEKVSTKNTKNAIIFLHGLVGSRRYWNKYYLTLSNKYNLYFVDLLGFGLSSKAQREYDLDTHVTALRKFILQEVDEEKIILVGHSLGSIISLAYGEKYPNAILKIYLMALPYYHSQEEAMSYIKQYTKPQYFVIDSFLTKATCTMFCYFGGPITRHVLPLFMRHIPKEVVSDGLLHTYNSYISTLYNVLYNQNVDILMSDKVKNKIILVHGEKDKVAPLKNIKEFARKYDLELLTLPNSNHGFPLEAKKKVLDIIQN